MSNIIKRIPPARGSERNKKAYEAWQRIWYKCKGEHKAKYAPQPILDERWYDFRAFEEWYEMEFSVFGEDDSPEIDKDLLSPSLEEKIYGPDNCVVIPNTLNSTIGIVHALMDMSRLEGIMRISMAYRDKLKPKVLTRLAEILVRHEKYIAFDPTLSWLFPRWMAFLMDVRVKYEMIENLEEGYCVPKTRYLSISLDKTEFSEDVYDSSWR